MSDNLSPYSAVKYADGMRKTMPFHETFYSETVSLIKYLKPGVNVWLDTGCGTGSLISRAYPMFKSTVFLLADPSSKMLDQARESLKDIPESQLEIIGSIGTESLPEQGLKKPQVITAILAHHYFNREERNIATRKCYEILEVDGVYLTFENIYPLTEEGKEIGLGRWKAYQQSQGKTAEEAANHISRYNRSFFPISIAEHIAILKKTGFRVAELFWFSNMQAGLYAIK